MTSAFDILEKLPLHDGEVNAIHAEETTLYFHVSFVDIQSKQVQIEKIGILSFMNVRMIDENPPLDSLNWEAIQWLSILKFIPAPHLDTESHYGVYVLLEVEGEASSPIVSLEFLASDVAWKEERASVLESPQVASRFANDSFVFGENNPLDIPEGRSEILGMLDESLYYFGSDSFDNDFYCKRTAKNEEIWVLVRHGIIFQVGLNTQARLKLVRG
jgi:hypothetical protein